MKKLPLAVFIVVAAVSVGATVAPAKGVAADLPERGSPYPDFSGVIDEYLDELLNLNLEDIVNPHLWVDTALFHLGQRGYASFTLTEEDYTDIAEELEVEPAVIKAVVEIETGKRHEGFWQEGKPLVNFDLAMYRKYAPLRGVSLVKAKKKAPEIFARPDVARHGSYQGAQYARLEAACAIDTVSALESCFWGMFQIGGFNWKQCGTADVCEFVRLMSRSERDQLELFARFISSNGMVNDLRGKKWLSFALKYNGPKARSRGYHTRLAAAYKRFSASVK